MKELFDKKEEIIINIKIKKRNLEVKNILKEKLNHYKK